MRNTGCLVLVLLAVVALVGYDQYRIEQMRSEVRAISTKVHVENGSGAGDARPASDLVTALAEAERFTKRAKQLISEKKTKEAQVELDKALKSLKSANGVSKDIVGDAAQFLGKARENAIEVFQKAWNDISEETKTQND